MANSNELNGQQSMMGVSLKDIKEAYNKVVRPTVALSLPGYMHRWVSQEIGMDGFWMYASLFQNAYGSGARMNDPEASSFSGRFSARQICRYSGMSLRTFWNRMKDTAFWEKLKPLITVRDEPRMWDATSSVPRQLARQFEVETTIPLTPNDIASLRTWIMERLEELGPEGVLRAATKTPRKELLAQVCKPEPAKTVEDLVVPMFKDQLDPKLLKALASLIHNNIMPGNDQINITLYFMEHVLPYMGVAEGYFLTLLRDKCFFSFEETRDTVKFAGGYDEIAGLMGLKGDGRARTVWNYLNAKYPKSHREAGKYRSAITRMYISEITKDETELDFAHQSRTFQVLMDEIPPTLFEASLTGSGFYSEMFHSDICTLGAHEIAQHPIWDKYQFNFCTLGVSTFAHGSFNFCTLGVSTFALASSRFAQVKALKLLNQTLNTYQPTPAATENGETEPIETESLENHGGGDVEQPPLEETPKTSAGRSVSWNFSKLAKTSDISTSKIATMTAAVPDEYERSCRFVGWMLHAHSPRGKGLKDDTGVGLAIASIDARPGNACMRLAGLGEQKLRSLFDQDFARVLGEESTEEMIYRANLKKLPLHRKQDLYYRLFAVDAPEPAIAIPERTPSVAHAENGTKAYVPFKVPRRQINITRLP